MRLSDDELSALEAEYGDVRAFDLGDETIVLRAPKRGDFDRWADSEKKSRDTRTLVETCLVHPDPVAFHTVLDAYPAVLKTELESAVAELGGWGKPAARRR